MRLGNQLALVVTNKVDIIRDGLSPVFIRFWHQTWISMSLRSWNSMQKYIVSSGHKFLNTGITVIRFTLGIRVSATAYLAWVTLLLVYIFIHNMVQFGTNFHKIFPFEVYLLVGTLWHLYKTSEIRVVCGELGANPTSFSMDRPNGLERSRKVVFWTGPGAKVNECVRSIVS